LNNLRVKRVYPFNSLLLLLSLWFDGFQGNLDLLEIFYFKNEAFMDSLDVLVEAAFVVESFGALVDGTLVFAALTLWNVDLFVLG
jgi:hypothetical protein